MKMKKYLIIAGCAVFATTITGCLKDKAPVNPDQSNDVIEIHNPIPSEIASPVTSTYPLFVEAFEVVPEAEHEFYINYAGANAAPQDIVVTLGLDEGAIQDYNSDNGTHYTLLPSNVYELDAWTVTIPAGQKKVTINAKFFTENFDLSEAYALPLKIMSVSSGTISSNFGTVLFAILAKNKYDGVYRAKGFSFMGNTNTTAPYLFSIDCSWGLELSTTGANSVAMNAQPVYRNGSIIYFGGIYPNIVFDPATDLVSDVAENGPGNAYVYTFPDPADPTYPSRYDEATKTIYLRYRLINATWYMIDTLTYCGPR